MYKYARIALATIGIWFVVVYLAQLTLFIILFFVFLGWGAAKRWWRKVK